MREFNKQCVEFVDKCQQLGDPWALVSFDDRGRIKKLIADETNIEDLDETRLMLMRNETKFMHSGVENRIVSCEYNVIYSSSYEVPAMYFCLSFQGKLITTLRCMKTDTLY